VDEKGLSRVNKSVLIGIAVGGIVGVIGAVLVMVLSRPIRPAAIEIRMPEPTAELPPTDMPLPTATPGSLHVYVPGAGDFAVLDRAVRHRLPIMGAGVFDAKIRIVQAD
jgi:hypothetical protein